RVSSVAEIRFCLQPTLQLPIALCYDWPTNHGWRFFHLPPGIAALILGSDGSLTPQGSPAHEKSSAPPRALAHAQDFSGNPGAAVGSAVSRCVSPAPAADADRAACGTQEHGVVVRVDQLLGVRVAAAAAVRDDRRESITAALHDAQAGA